MRRLGGLLLAILALLGVLAVPAIPQDEGALRDRIERSKAREQQLSGAVARLGDLLTRTQHDIVVVQGRLAEVEADLAIARARLAATRVRLESERARLARLRRRL